MFDHTMLVAADDPHLPASRHWPVTGSIDIRIVPAVGCEATAKLAYEKVKLSWRSEPMAVSG